MKLTTKHYLYMLVLIGGAVAVITIVDEFFFSLGTLGQWLMDSLSLLAPVPFILATRLEAKEKERTGACRISEHGGLGKREIMIIVVLLEILGWAFLLMVMHIAGLI